MNSAPAAKTAPRAYPPKNGAIVSMLANHHELGVIGCPKRGMAIFADHEQARFYNSDNQSKYTRELAGHPFGFSVPNHQQHQVRLIIAEPDINADVFEGHMRSWMLCLRKNPVYLGYEIKGLRVITTVHPKRQGWSDFTFEAISDRMTLLSGPLEHDGGLDDRIWQKFEDIFAHIAVVFRIPINRPVLTELTPYKKFAPKKRLRR